jgi:hypothetical protein
LEPSADCLQQEKGPQQIQLPGLKLPSFQKCESQKPLFFINYSIFDIQLSKKKETKQPTSFKIKKLGVVDLKIL